MIVSLEECEDNALIVKQQKCKSCNGSGKSPPWMYPNMRAVDCIDCKGVGFTYEKVKTYRMSIIQKDV